PGPDRAGSTTGSAMTRCLTLALALAAAMAGRAVIAGQPAPFRAETRLVALRATVKNSRGELVTNLPQRAFTVYENGQRQPIALFLREHIPVSLGLVIDNSGSMRPLRARAGAAARPVARA